MKLYVIAAGIAAILFAATAYSQVGVEIGRHGVGVEVGAPINVEVPPNCPYGYYEFSPYECAPEGFYGPGYFYNGIFIGVGPWHNWGYRHGWGEHRFNGGGGGRYDHRHARNSVEVERNGRGHSQQNHQQSHAKSNAGHRK